MNTRLAEPYHMTHPGPVSEKRHDWAHVNIVTGWVGADETRQTLTKAIERAARMAGVSSGTGWFTDGKLERLRFTTGGPARDGRSAHYTYIRERGEAVLHECRFTFGETLDGEFLVHAHAVIETDHIDAPFAGHLFPDDCMLDGTASVHIAGFHEAMLVQKADAETLHSVFEIWHHVDRKKAPAAVVRIRPNEDAVEALETICSEAGFAAARVVSAIGSFNEPILVEPGDHPRRMESVGMEAVSVAGVVRPDTPGLTRIEATICNEDGEIFRGALVRGHAPVCITIEALVEEIKPES